MSNATYSESVRKQKTLTESQVLNIMREHGIMKTEREEYLQEAQAAGQTCEAYNANNLMNWLGY